MNLAKPVFCSLLPWLLAAARGRAFDQAGQRAIRNGSKRAFEFLEEADHGSH